MQLKETVSPSIKQLSGDVRNIIVEAGKKITIETSPGGVEILDIEVPAGEQWEIRIGVDVRVTNV